jgi:peptidoglycan pentaglycine glycine transferase (the first glycine)
MIICRPITERNTWEAFQEKQKPEALFQQWVWGDIQKKMGTTVTRIGMYNDTVLIGIFQYVVVRARRGSFLHVRHGPIFIEQRETYWEAFTDWITKEAKRCGVWFVRVSPLENVSEDMYTLFARNGYRSAPIHAMDAELCWVLPLTEPEEELLKQMRKTTRYEIRRAMDADVSITGTKDPKDLQHFIDLYKETSTRHGFVPHLGIREEFEILAKEDKSILYLGSYKGTITSAAIILFIGGQGIYHHGASVRSEIPVSYLLQWEAIKEAKKRGMKVYNFWGIAPENNPKHPWRGITLFKKGFGGYIQEYIHAHDLPVSPFYIIPSTIETIRRMRKGY